MDLDGCIGHPGATFAMLLLSIEGIFRKANVLTRWQQRIVFRLFRSLNMRHNTLRCCVLRPYGPLHNRRDRKRLPSITVYRPKSSSPYRSIAADSRIAFSAGCSRPTRNNTTPGIARSRRKTRSPKSLSSVRSSLISRDASAMTSESLRPAAASAT